MASGQLDALEDDIVLRIMHLLVEIPDGCFGQGLQLHQEVCQGAANLSCLVASCRRMVTILTTSGKLLEQEMLARGATHIPPSPLQLSTSEYPFTHQVRLESRSADQLKFLRSAIGGMAVHCAGPCCKAARTSVNAQLRNSQDSRAGYVAAATDRSTVVSASVNGQYAFVASRKRVHKSDRRHSPSLGASLRGHKEVLLRMGFKKIQSSTREAHTRVECVQLNSLELRDDAEFGAPQSMRSSQDGACVAVIRAVHSSAVNEHVPHSAVHLWHPTSKEFLHLQNDLAEAQQLGAINAQDAWWLDEEESRKRLVVLWSTAYVHPMGTVVGANADNACYFIAVYHSDLTLESYTGPFHGKAQTASPDAKGSHVAVLVRKSPLGNGPMSLPTRCTKVHDIFEETAVEIDHTEAIRTGNPWPLPPHPHDLVHCPSAVALSPRGDCIVAIHRRYATVILEVLIRTAAQVFVSVQSMDVTHWTAIGINEPSVFDSPGSVSTAASLKLPYRIVFSPCGRFAAIADQRPLFGLSITNHALLVLDMALRHERRGVRALPLAPVEDVAPRSLEWTDAGMWLQPKFGTLLLCDV